MSLFDPARHEPLDPADVGPANARDVCAELVEGVWAAQRPDGRWPMHPNDMFGPDLDHGRLDLYVGAAGVLWARWWLAERGWCEAVDVEIRRRRATEADSKPSSAGLESRSTEPAGAGVSFGSALGAIVGAWPRPADSAVPSWFLAESGVLAAAMVAGGVDGLDDRLVAVIRSNRDNPTLEPLWGASGTLVAARLMALARPDDPRWAAEVADSRSALLASMEAVDGVPIWTQDLYGSQRQLLGAGHGFVGNVHAILEVDDASDLARSFAATVVRFAESDGQHANWPSSVDSHRPPLVQWCHGSPGVITALAGRIAVGVDAAFDDVLVKAGELVWHAGPLTKGSGLCHGTAGNGYALLALHARTGDPRWLERAWAFAGHAVAQSRAARGLHGMPRATLWTGDMGVACFVRACAERDARWPTLDVL